MMALTLYNGPSQRSDPTASLSQALQSFECILTKSQKEQFQTTAKPDASSVIRFVCQIDANNQHRAARCVAPRLYSFLDKTQQFVNVVDTFVSSNPAIAALIWGSVKTAILTASNIVNYFDKVTAMIMNIGRFCPTYQQFGLLYPDSVALQTALCDYYAVIIRLCSKVVEISQRSGIGHLISSVFNPFEAEFKPCLDELDACIKVVGLQISFASNQAEREVAKLIELERKQNESHWRKMSLFQRDMSDGKTELQRMKKMSEQKEADALRSAIRRNLSVIDQEKPWKQAWRQRAPTTADWFEQNDEFKAWREDKNTSIIWCIGKLGSGKTVFTSNIVSYLLRQQKPTDKLAYFFCRSDQQETLIARSIIGCLVRQILDDEIQEASKLALESMFQQIQQIQKLESELEGVAKFLESRIEAKKTYTLILDGIEECEKSEIRQAFQQLGSLFQNFPGNLKILISARPEIEREFGMLNSFIKHRILLANKEAEMDIGRYIYRTLDECLFNDKLKLGDPGLVLQIQDSLQSKADGSFLWTKLVIEEICEQDNDKDIISSLQSLPNGLSEVFERKLSRVFKSKRLDRVIKTLQFCMVMRRPLTLDELREALTVTPGQDFLDKGSLSNDMDGILSDCHGLLYIDEEEEAAHCVHHSVRTHLLDGQSTCANQFNEADLDQYWGVCCMTYINFQDFKRQLIKYTPAAPIINPLQMGIAAVCQRPKIRSIARHLLKERGENSITTKTINKQAQTDHLRPTFTHISTKDSHQYHFLGYAKIYWINHLKEIKAVTDDSIWELYQKCMDDEETAAERPWEKPKLDFKSSSSSITDSYSLSQMVGWAMENDNLSLLLYLAKFWRSNTSPILPRDSVIREILFMLVERGPARLLKMLVASTAVLITGRSFQDILLRAASIGNAAAVDILFAFKNRNQQWVNSPMPAAIRNGHVDVVKLLIELGQDVHDYESLEDGELPLRIAAEQSNMKILELLIAAGAHDNWAPSKSTGRTALQTAAERGDITMVNLLLEAAKRNLHMPPVRDYAFSALEAALKVGNLDVLRQIVVAGGLVNRTPWKSLKLTLLEYAVRHNYVKTVEKLLAAACTDAIAKRNALLEAVITGNLELTEMLLSAKASCNYINSRRHAGSILQAAAEFGHVEIVRRLLTAGASEDGSARFYAYETWEDLNCPSPLFAAVSGGHIRVVEILLDAGANPNYVGQGITTIGLAAKNGHLEIVKELLMADVIVNAKHSQFDRTALEYALKGGYEEIVRVLRRAEDRMYA